MFLESIRQQLQKKTDHYLYKITNFNRYFVHYHTFTQLKQTTKYFFIFMNE